MKQAFRFLCAIILAALGSGVLSSVEAQVSSPTPDPFTAQLTTAPLGFKAVAEDMSANGRFVVFVSNGDVATVKNATRNNADGNTEIFLADYAQRRIFQITNTKNVLKPAASPSPTPTPSASPSPSPSPAPTPEDLSQVKIRIVNDWPAISLAPALSGGTRSYVIVFSSNAPNPASFDGTEGTLATDGNKEIWIYRLPAVADVDLTLGADIPFEDLNAGTFVQITNTPASRVPSAGTSTLFPIYADDNRESAISDDGLRIAFTSTRNLAAGGGNADGNPEIFFYNVATGTFVQGTDTQDAVAGQGFIFQQNPNLSSDGSIVSFYSSANLAGQNNDDSSGGNAEIYIATYTGTAMTNVRQVTRTKVDPTNGRTVNVFSPGRRMSRDGSLIAFESIATDPKANSSSNGTNNLALFVYTVATDTFTQIGTRAEADIGKHPVFTDYNGSLVPGSLVFASFLNIRPDGTIPASGAALEGLNPQRSAQIFLTQLPASSSSTFVRLTNVPFASVFGGTRPIPSDSRKRIAFSLGGVDLGGGNADFSNELYYLLTPLITAESSVALSFSTGASDMPVPNATPTPTPGASPTPTPSPTPVPSPSPGTGIGLAPGELSIVRSTVALAPSDATASGASETLRSPALPIELNGVSLSVNGTAAGLYFVGDSSKQINFVMPITVTLGVGRVAVNVLNAGAGTDTIFRGFVPIVLAQPDVFTTTNGPDGRAIAVNVTNPASRTPEPFSVTSPDPGGNNVATILELSVTGVRSVLAAEVTVTVGTTAITAGDIVFIGPNKEMPGLDIINFKLPASLAGAGDVPVVVTVNKSGLMVTSRPSSSAPHITINEATSNLGGKAVLRGRLF
ncbi:MAG TPA: hypothetical protein VF251_14430 [Pyrinomonadaceae bacterium]